MTNERDTHFVGFAKLLYDELVGNYGSIELYNWDEEGVARFQCIIAQHAYDLAIYLYEFIPMLQGMYPNLLTVQDVIRHIPDLTEWPNTSPEAP